MIPFVEGDVHLGPLEPRRCGEGVNGIHLLLGDAALPTGFILLGAPEYHEAALGLGELIVFLLGAICRVISLRGRLLGLALLAEGAMDVALHDSAVLEKMLRLPPNGTGRGLERCWHFLAQSPSVEVLSPSLAMTPEMPVGIF